MGKLALIAAIVTLSGASLAQRQAGNAGGHGPVVHPSFTQSNRGGFRITAGRPGDFRGRGFRNSSLYYPWPYYSDFYPGYYDSSYEEPPAPPAPSAATPAQSFSNEPVPSPALLELQGNQWVKVNSFTIANTGASQNAPMAGTASAKEMPPAVLVYRDGHTEELSSYTIIDGAIRTKSDYWTNGSWIRTIQIADLDVPATLKQNQERGVKFDLPSGPNEVIIRP